MSFTNMVVLAVTFTAVPISASWACNVDPTNPGDAEPYVTMKAYTDCLLKDFGEDGRVMNGKIFIRDPDGIDLPPAEWPADSQKYGFSVTTLSTSIYYYPSKPLCSIILARTGTAASPRNWCKDTTSVPGYDVKEDIWSLSNGRLVPVGSRFYDCDSTADRSKMPPIVQMTVCF